VPADKNNIMKAIYTFYGFSAMSMYNTILSTLDFYIARMPGYNPDFVFSFVLTVLVIFCAFFVILYSYKLNFYVKNNLVILLEIPITLGLPLLNEYVGTSKGRFISFIIVNMLISAVYSL